jgi:hypothetical protein
MPKLLKKGEQRILRTFSIAPATLRIVEGTAQARGAALGTVLDDWAQRELKRAQRRHNYLTQSEQEK